MKAAIIGAHPMETRGLYETLAKRQIANSFEKGKELYDLAVDNNVELSCGVDAIFGAGIQTARYMLDHDVIGKVHSASAVLVRDNHFIAELLPHVMRPGGGVLYDMTGYFLMPMFFFFGSVKRLQAYGEKGEPVHEVKKVGSEHRGLKIQATEYEVITIILEFENDVMVTFHLNSNGVFQKTLFKVAGDYGVLDIGYPHEFDAPVSLTTFGMQKTDIPFRFGLTDPVYGVGLADLAWAVKNNRKARIDKKIALHDLEVITGIEKSIAFGEVYEMTTSIERPKPLEEGYFGNGFWTTGEETALAL